MLLLFVYLCECFAIPSPFPASLSVVGSWLQLFITLVSLTNILFSCFHRQTILVLLKMPKLERYLIDGKTAEAANFASVSTVDLTVSLYLLLILLVPSSFCVYHHHYHRFLHCISGIFYTYQHLFLVFFYAFIWLLLVWFALSILLLLLIECSLWSSRVHFLSLF